MYVTGNDLILSNPTQDLADGTRFLYLRKMPIIKMKFLMQHTDSRGNNLFLKIPRVGEYNIEFVLKMIQMYEEQIIRQSKETEVRDINLFHFQYDEKRKIVEENLWDIVSYLIDNTSEEFIWGKLTEPQKKLLISSVVNEKQRDRLIRGQLTEIITNYTTLSELESGITFDEKWMEEDFDEEKYNQMMENQFGDEFYNQNVEDNDIKQLIISCWCQNPNIRLTIEDIVPLLETKMMKQIYQFM